MGGSPNIVYAWPGPGFFHLVDGRSRPTLVKAFVLALALEFLLVGCPSPAKKSREKLALQGIEFSEKALFEQIRSGQTDVVRLFLAAGMPPDTQEKGFSPLLEAARRGYSEMAMELIKSRANINARDPYGVTVLMFSLIAGSTDVAMRLIEEGADVNCRDVDGRTALVEALTSENEIPPEIVDSLIRRGADVNIRLPGGLTPLMIAVSGDPRVVRLLVEAGADVRARDDQGADVRRRAKDHPENIRILEEAQAGLLPVDKKEDS
jgi:ankyrin repeat protein